MGLPIVTIFKEFKKCPRCGCKDTIVKAACADLVEKRIMPEGTFVSLQKVQLPLITVTQATLSVPTLLFHYDHCLDCGKKYLIRVEKMDIPITAMPKKGFGGFGLDPSGPFPFNKG